ncbi:MAG: O-antigen ligase family protein [Candidatus Jorgensenbacteria bacterium]
MLIKAEKILSWVVKILLFLTVLTPFVVTPAWHLFPYVFGKTIFYRAIIEIALGLGVALLAVRAWRGRIDWSRFKSKLLILIFLFFVAAAVSTLLAPDLSHAFFGDVERGEGFFGLLHYLVFLILALALFNKRDWLFFFGGLSAVAVIVSFYAWLQYFGVTDFLFSLKPSTQPGSFTGNPAFLSSFLIISLAALVFLFEEVKNRTWRVIFVLGGLFITATVFITAIRGAALGIVAGLLVLALSYLFSRSTPRKIKGIAGLLIILLFVFGIGFWLTKDNAVWRSVPVLHRFARVSLENPSVATRLIGLKVSGEAFLERPVFGWGPENYNVAYNKHYDPAYSYYAEDWFDRAHNKIAEVGVLYGGVGLILYLGILGLTFAMVRKRPFFVGVFAAYVVQNLFLFDNIVSYIPLFAVWGYLIFERRPAESVNPIGPISLIKRIGPVLGAIVVILGVAYSLYNWHYVPVRQALVYADVARAKVGDKILVASDSFLYPYNFFQPTLRAQFSDMIYNNDLIKSLAFRPLVLKAAEALEETAALEKEPRQYARLVETYNELAKQEEKYFEKSEPFARKALEFSPNRQGLLHHLSFTLAGLNRFDEAVAINRQALELDPRVYKSVYQLGIALSLAADSPGKKGTVEGDALRAEAKENLDQAWEMAKANDYLFFQDYDFRNLITIYARWKDFRRAAEVLEVTVGRLPTEQNYLDLISLYRTLRDVDGIIRTAEGLKNVKPSLVDDLDVIIDLARKENWEILDQL